MNKKIIGGLFALLFITSGVQSLAISKLQKTVGLSQAQVVAMTSSQNDYNFNNQQAAVGAYDTTPSDPDPDEPAGLWGFNIYVFMWSDGSCDLVYTYNNAAYLVIEFNDCAGIPVQTIENATVVKSNGDSSTGYLQINLWVTKYLDDISQVTGKMDATTKTALRSFQKVKSLPQTGTYGPQTKIALDKEISTIKQVQYATDAIQISPNGGPSEFPWLCYRWVYVAGEDPYIEWFVCEVKWAR